MANVSEEKVKSMIDQAIKQHADSAFAQGDTGGHRRAHEQQIEEFRAKKKLKEDTLHKIITSIAWAAIVGIAMAIWYTLKKELSQ